MKNFQELFEDIATGKKSPVKKMSSASIIATGYLLLVILGTMLLMIPFASKDAPPRIIDAAFTAISATCVTGLVVFDTYTQWSVFGQIVILILIQIGGMGFMTIISLTAMATGRKIGLKERSVLQDSVNNLQLGGIVRMVQKIAIGTFLVEGIGAALLAVRFIPRMGFWSGLGNSIFMSISAFCNAGFDLNGKYGEYSSLMAFNDDIVVNITICLLITIGGIGFMVWDDILKNKLKFSSYTLHSKIVLTMTSGLIVFGTLLFFIFEHNYTSKGLDIGTQILTALFSAVTPRTAGFNTVDTASLSPVSTVLTIIYMIIGGSPGSTAGGLKTATIAVLFITAFSNMKNSEDANIFGRRLEADAPVKALTVLMVNMTLALTAIITILSIQPQFRTVEITFEVFSAINTTGMSLGITRELCDASRIVIMLMMFCGRVGSVTFALLFTRKNQYSGVHNPEEQVSIG